MGTIKSLAKGLRSINLERQIPIMINATKETLVNYNKDQLLHGLTSEGVTGANLRGYRSYEYAVFKNAMNSLPEFGTPDLRLTGAFYSGIKAEISATEITMYSTDIKAPDLETKFTIFIYGVNRKNMSEYAGGVLYTEFKNYITLKSGLLFH